LPATSYVLSYEMARAIADGSRARVINIGTCRFLAIRWSSVQGRKHAVQLNAMMASLGFYATLLGSATR